MASSSPSDEADAARLELAACEREISNVKALLRSLNPTPGGGAGGAGNGGFDATKNRLTVSWLKVRIEKLTMDEGVLPVWVIKL